MRKTLVCRGRGCVLAAALGLVLASPAGALTLALDPDLSRISFEDGSSRLLEGTLDVQLGAQPPITSKTSFDLVGLSVVGDGLAVGLDPDLQNPGLGVLSPDGSFLIPTLFLRVDRSGTVFDQTLVDVTGDLGSCGEIVCLESRLAIDTGGPEGILDVRIVAFAVPEPASIPLLGLGFAGAWLARRRWEVQR